MKHCKWGVKKKPKTCQCETSIFDNSERRWLNGGDKTDNGQMVRSQQEEWSQSQGQSSQGLLAQDCGESIGSRNSLSGHGILSTSHSRVQTQEEIANASIFGDKPE